MTLSWYVHQGTGIMCCAKPNDVLRALLCWPAGCRRLTDTVQANLHSGKQYDNCNFLFPNYMLELNSFTDFKHSGVVGPSTRRAKIKNIRDDLSGFVFYKHVY